MSRRCHLPYEHGIDLSADRAIRSGGTVVRKALELYQKLVEAHPSVTDFRSNLAKSHYNAGLVQSETGQHDLALRSYARAIEIHQGLADANPSVIGFQRDLAASQVNLGVVEGELGRPQEAVRSYERAIAIFEKLAAANPSVTEFRSNLAQRHVNIGFMRRDAGDPEQASVVPPGTLDRRRTG